MHFFNIVIILNIIKALAVPTGVYHDNGLGQTVLEHFSSAKEKNLFEREMLNILGIARKPRRSFNTSSLTTSASKYLMEVYKINKKMEIANEFNLDRNEIKEIQDSDAVLTFSSRVQNVQISQKKHGRKLWFEMKSDIPEEHIISNAQLRIYKHDEGFAQNSIYEITIEQITVGEDERELEFIDAMNTTSDYQGWMTFNFTSSLLSWIALPSESTGVRLTVHEYVTDKFTRAKKIAPESIGVITSSSEPDLEPFVITFLKFDSTKPRRQNRDMSNRKKINDFESNPFVPEPVSSWINCQMQTLYVDFRDLKWDSWIVAPTGYAAHYCFGKCQFPAIGRMDSTNHAIVQTLMNFIDPKSVPPACCAPSKYSHLQVIYYLEDGGILLKKFRNMVIEGCSCQ